MIDLTPLEVRQKKGDFRRAFRGYDAELVNDFLDLVADRMEELVKENMGLRDRVEALEGELERFRAKEKSLTEALVSSQEMREDAQKQAERSAEMVLREAELKAREREDRAAQTLAREEIEIRRLKARRAQLVRSFRQFLERELAELDILEETLDLKDGEGLEGWGAEAVDAVRTVAADAEPESDHETGDTARAVDAEGPLLDDPPGEEGRVPDGLPGLEGTVATAAEPEAGGTGAVVEGTGEAVEDDEEQTDWLSSIVEERD